MFIFLFTSESIQASYELIGSYLTIEGNDSITKDGVKKVTINLIETCEIREGIIGIETESFYGCDKLTKIIFPKSLKYIRKGAFQKTPLVELNINSGLEVFDAVYLFYESSKLKKVTVASDNLHFRDFDDCMYSKDFSSLVLVPMAKTTINFPTNVKTIKTWAFYRAQIGDTIFPDTIERIDNMAFVDQISSGRVIFTQTSNLSTIANGGFWSSKFPDFFLPPKVKSLGNDAFTGSRMNTFDFIYNSSLEKLEGKTFSGSSNLKNVHLPSSVTQISPSVFSGCSSLQNVTIDKNDIFISQDGSLSNSTQIIFISPSARTFNISAGITTLPNSVFQLCENMTELNIENGSIFQYKDGVIYKDEYKTAIQALGSFVTLSLAMKCTKIESYAFSPCARLKYFNCKDNIFLTTINEGAFRMTRKLISVSLPPTVNSIGVSAFSSSSLQSINIPRDLKTISGSLFRQSGSLINVTFDEDSLLEQISENSFSGTSCKNLQRFPAKLKIIQGQTFKGIQVESLHFPPSLISIEDRAFQNCKKLKTITFEQTTSTLTVGVDIFASCGLLQKVTLPGKLNSLSNGFLKGCTNLITIEWNGNIETTSIEDSALAQTKISSYTIPSTVQRISPGAFRQCFSLTNFSVESENYFTIKNYMIYNLEGTYLYCYPPGRTEVVIASSTTTILNNVFYQASLLKTVDFPTDCKVERIGEQTFAKCTELKHIDFPALLSQLEGSAFEGCDKLEEIIFANESKLISIGKSTFSSCINLKKIDFGTNSHLQTIDVGSFKDCGKLESIKLPSRLRTLGSEAFMNCSSLIKVEFDDDIIGQV